ncbi:hypothetical protein NDU88_007091 [Pleurodeles waltl]|uniref:Uncharacterized protein n=1 Tax=Pleurodeles waltl TaxID=8319 RepID=A0AAV7PKM1_PLEWA|nr:hypothetical protein NDU88_007091 [Pleurodeles waltl]
MDAILRDIVPALFLKAKRGGPPGLRGNRKRYLACPPVEQAPPPVTLGAAKQKLGVPRRRNQKRYLCVLRRPPVEQALPPVTRVSLQ